MSKQSKAPGLILSGTAVFCGLAVLAVLGFMILLGMPVIKSGMLWQILTDPWSPDHGQFGIFAMTAGTFYIAGLSMVISLPVSLGCAFFIHSVQPGRPGQLLKKTVQLMTAVPTVIYGFVGIFLLVPFIRGFFSHGSGFSILSAALMLAMVISPTMILFFSQSLEQVPKSFINAVDALGGTPFQRLVLVIIPHAWPGMVSGAILAFGRAMGDTLIALMISGNSVMMPLSPLDSARTLTAHIAMVIAADFESMEFKTIFICGLTLYLLTGAGIVMARFSLKKGRL